jgi:FkbM family methyltransferase
MPSPIGTLLADFDISPVLVDVGASGEPPPVWREIAAYSTYVGFDPDLREIHVDRLSQYRASVIINAAVTERADVDVVPFYLTASPFCSTTLDPNPPATAHWLEGPKFVVEAKTALRATTLDSVLKQRQLATVDWIKLDTQGTDLRLINSLASDVLSKVMAIDTEPGLIEIYQGEDLFVDVHRDLTKKGFWLSNIHTGGFIRMRNATLRTLPKRDTTVAERDIQQWVRTTPAYFEARYLRTLEWLADCGLSAREYTLLWIFALVDGQLGFALDVNAEFEQRFGASDRSRRLNELTWQLIEDTRRRQARTRIYAAVARRLNALAQKILRS